MCRENVVVLLLRAQVLLVCCCVLERGAGVVLLPGNGCLEEGMWEGMCVSGRECVKE